MKDVKDLHGYYFEDLKEGMSASFGKTITESDIYTFAGVSGDLNPVHVNEDFAKSTMFKGRIAHGMIGASFISAVLGTKLPGPGAVYISQTLEFHGPVKIGDVVTISVEVVELIEKGRRVALYCEAKVDGRKVLDGQATVSVPRRPAPKS